MAVIKKLDLLQELKKRHPDGVIEATNEKSRNFVILLELGDKDFRTPEMICFLKEFFNPAKNDIFYVVNLKSIDVLTPCSARILVESASDIALELKTPVLFTNVQSMAMESLESQACRFNPNIIVWAIDEEGKPHLVGQVPNKVKELLNLLQEKGSASASQIASLQEGNTSKKTVGNLSVYLQKMFNAGLVIREKVTALERKDALAGWTYIYKTPPTILQQLEQE
ncbi:hypothetical protein WA1_50340 [Scytonema hofmannii PCC 7110]|uniref:Uncharacterized protein n=1 Tax=Scytonema hofmannii PCC 7110 TaxID=128403 RepID=A0A139WR58_9CYAN|nr:hypothetical protein [Scytonema hofmannii]KYC34925.1 hypothetical protein WA1_50340 [Scytonema hofmannii PCC 7110]